jgi:MGT family glycosyltransferase
LLPLVASLARRNLNVHVMTRPEVRQQVEAAGARFNDLFARYSLEAVDNESIPLPSRLVTFAAAYAEPLAADVAELDPALIVYDSFAVVAPLIGRRLGIPYVGMRAGHAQIPAQAIAAIRQDSRVQTSAACHAAVERLRTECGMSDASPFAYLDGVSPYLNLYPEPPQFIGEDVRHAFEPIAFFGSLSPDMRERESWQRPFPPGTGRRRVYISFGTAIWRYYAPVALGAMERLVDAFAERDNDVLMSLGHHAIDDDQKARIERPHVRVETYVDQWSALKDADLFVTHHGLNSTHEAIFHLVPMLSYPFHGDQPAMADCCHSLGLAMPLADSLRSPLDAADVRRRIDGFDAGGDAFRARLSDARAWEIETLERREEVVDRILALA